MVIFVPIGCYGAMLKFEICVNPSRPGPQLLFAAAFSQLVLTGFLRAKFRVRSAPERAF